MTDEVASAYDALADSFHLVHEDWRAAVTSQGAALDGVLTGALGPGSHDVLDCSCGIGTQAIGLALKGHRVLATDLSAASLERAAAEARSFGVELRTRLADMRSLPDDLEGSFDVVLTCDNSIAHLSPDELVRAVAGFRGPLRSSGLALVSLRDYAPLLAERPRLTSARVRGVVGSRAVSLQLWEWAPDGRSYEATLFILREDEGWAARTETVRLHAHLEPDVVGAFASAGFADARWREPSQTGYYQPLVTGRRS